MTLHKGLHDTQESMNYGNRLVCTGKRAFRVEDSQRLVTTLWGGGTATQTLLSSKFRNSWCRILAMTWHTNKDRQTHLEILYFAADSICPWICSAGICMCLFSMNHYPAAAWGASRTSSYQSKHGGDDNSWYLSSVRLIRKPQWGVGVDFTASWVQQLLATNSRCLWVGGWNLHFEICLKTWISSFAHSSKWCCSQLSLVEWQGLVNIDLTQIGESLSCLWTIVFIAIKLKFIVLSLSAFCLDISQGILT